LDNPPPPERFDALTINPYISLKIKLYFKNDFSLMFIRKVKTRTMKDGRTYHAIRLVHNVRYGNKVKQETLLNLGSNYKIHERNWTKLSHRIQELFVGQATFLSPLPKHLEDEAQRIVELLFARRSERLKKAKLAHKQRSDPH